MSESNQDPDLFYCPGEAEPISRAMHLARLSASSPRCRECPHRNDTEGISPKMAKRLADAYSGEFGGVAFGDEGLSGVLLNELTPNVVQRAATAFGLWLREQENTVSTDSDWPTVVLSSDGRRLTSPLVAAAARGLRFAGCHVMDIGQATAGCLVFASHQSQAEGSLSISSLGRRTHEATLRFWHNAVPLSRDAGLEQIEAIYGGHLDRPTRRFGALRRVSFEGDYLASLAGYYHGLRPLRIALDTPYRFLVEYLHRLCCSLECQIFDSMSDDVAAHDLVVNNEAHLGVSIDDNGETICVFDERGEEVSQERILQLVGHYLLEHAVDQVIQADLNRPAIVVEETTNDRTEEALRACGYRVVRAGGRRAEMGRAMEQEKALFGGGPTGRFWHVQPERVTADALLTLSCLLVILSQSDRPLSEVLDETIPAE